MNKCFIFIIAAIKKEFLQQLSKLQLIKKSKAEIPLHMYSVNWVQELEICDEVEKKQHKALVKSWCLNCEYCHYLFVLHFICAVRSYTNETARLQSSGITSEHASTCLGLWPAEHWCWETLHQANGSPICKLANITLSRSHGSESCKDDQQSQWEMLNFDPATTHDPLNWSSPNLACVITSWISSTKIKLGSIR